MMQTCGVFFFFFGCNYLLFIIAYCSSQHSFLHIKALLFLLCNHRRALDISHDRIEWIILIWFFFPMTLHTTKYCCFISYWHVETPKYTQVYSMYLSHY